jgi:hypothetical protein
MNSMFCEYNLSLGKDEIVFIKVLILTLHSILTTNINNRDSDFGINCN